MLLYVRHLIAVKQQCFNEKRAGVEYDVLYIRVLRLMVVIVYIAALSIKY